MNKTKKPSLVSPLHDPKAVYLPLVEKWAPLLPNLYSLAILGVSQKTSPKLIKKLKKIGFIILRGDYDYSQGYHQALAYGLKKGGEIFHCSDFDRLLHWVASYPQELKKTFKKAYQADYIILGRTKRAFATHPLSWQLTEKINNALLSKVLGFKVDIGAGSAILNREAAEIISSKSKEPNFSILAEWPLLVKKAGLKIGYLAVEGYEWEDPDRFQKEIKKIDYQKWLENYDDMREWKKRLEITNQIAKLFFKHD